MIKVELQFNGKTMDCSVIQFWELTSCLANHETKSLFLYITNARWIIDINKSGIKLLFLYSKVDNSKTHNHEEKAW